MEYLSSFSYLVEHYIFIWCLNYKSETVGDSFIIILVTDFNCVWFCLHRAHNRLDKDCSSLTYPSFPNVKEILGVCFREVFIFFPSADFETYFICEL